MSESIHSDKDNTRGALLMSASMAGFVFNDTLLKTVSDDVSLFPALFIRGIVASLLLGILAWRKNQLFPKINRKDKQVLGFRAVGEIGATLCFLTALFNMPIANATAILQAMPLAVTLAAAVFFRQAVGWRRYVAIGIGFLGVLLIVRPGAEGFNSYSMFAVVAVFFLVVRDLSTRQLSPTVPSSFVAFSAAALIMMTGLIGSFFTAWIPVSWGNILILSVAACFIVIGYICAVMAMRIGDISFVSPFRYSILLWAILLGFLVFNEVPDGLTLLGTLIVAGMGVFTFYRERIKKQQTG